MLPSHHKDEQLLSVNTVVGKSHTLYGNTIYFIAHCSNMDISPKQNLINILIKLNLARVGLVGVST